VVEPLNDNFMREMRAGMIEPIWLVWIVWTSKGVTIGEDGEPFFYDVTFPTTYQWVSGDVARFGYQPSIVSVGSIASRLNPLTRVVTAAGTEVVFRDDGTLRLLLREKSLRSQKLILFKGTANLVKSDYEKRFDGIITDILPERGVIRVMAEDWRSTGAAKEPATLRLGGVPPYTALREIMRRAGATNLDEDSFVAPDAKAHWMTSISNSDDETWTPAAGVKVEGGEPLKFSIDEMAFLLGGCIRSRYPDAITEWHEYDPDADAVRMLTADDVLDVQQLPVATEYNFNKFSTDLKGKIAAASKKNPNPEESEKVLAFWHMDGAAAARNGCDVRTHEFESRLFHNRAQVLATFGTGYGSYAHEDGEWWWWTIAPGHYVPFNENTTEFALFSPTYCGIAGSQTSSDLELSAPLSEERIAYFMLVGSGCVEIVSANACAIVQARDVGMFDDDYDADVSGVLANSDLPEYASQFVKYTIAERGLLGSTQQRFYLADIDFRRSPRPLDESDYDDPIATELWAYDITPLVACCTRNLDRFADPLLMLRVVAHQQHVDLEYGDAIALQHALAATYRIDGLTGNEVFEVVEKEEIDSPQPSVVLTLAWMRTAELTPLERIDVFNLPAGFQSTTTPFDRVLQRRSRVFDRYVRRGGLYSP